MKLPNVDRAVVELMKLSEYVLSPTHPRALKSHLDSYPQSQRALTSKLGMANLQMLGDKVPGPQEHTGTPQEQQRNNDRNNRNREEQSRNSHRNSK